MQYVFFEKKDIRSVQWVWGIFENFCVKSNLTVCCKVTFNCRLSYRKNGVQDVLVAPANNFVGEATAPLLPRFPHLCQIKADIG